MVNRPQRKVHTLDDAGSSPAPVTNLPCIFAIDPGQIFGWAWCTGRHVVYGTKDLRSDSVGVFLRMYFRWFQEAVSQNAVVVVERPYISHHHKDFNTVHRLMAQVGVTQMITSNFRLRCVLREASAARKLFLGKPVPRKREDCKEAVMARCAELGFNVLDDHQGDALCLLVSEAIRMGVGIEEWQSVTSRMAT